MFGKKKQIIEQEKEAMERKERERVLGELKAEEEKRKEIKMEHPVATAVETTLDSKALKLYKEKADKIGFQPASLFNAELKEFFKENDIKLFNNDEVSKYLDYKVSSEFGEDGDYDYVWVWTPLREKDISGFHPIWNSNGSHTNIPYQHEIPLRVLGVIEKIEERFGDKVQFYVNDYQIANPDPFIMLTKANGSDHFIFDCWDEPEFIERG